MAGFEGRLITRAADIELMLDAGFTITPDDIDAEEMAALRILRSERRRVTPKRG